MCPPDADYEAGIDVSAAFYPLVLQYLEGRRCLARAVRSCYYQKLWLQLDYVFLIFD